jgi:hypothetical protein
MLAGPEDRDRRARVQIHDVAHIPGRDMYALTASDHTIGEPPSPDPSPLIPV